jgi:hypothetical protein
MEPSVRQNVYDAYWRFAAKRQRIFEMRAARQPGPWTDDPILGRFKFCNAFRASDRVSQYLISQVIYRPAVADLAPEDAFLRIVLFRLFSKESTWQTLEDSTGGVTRATLDLQRLGKRLDSLRKNQAIYTSAFILCAYDPYGHRAKHRNHLELVQRMFARGGLGADLARARSLKDVVDALRRWPMIGDFMGYQLAIDLNYSPHLDFNENDFTVPGPGAVRGLRKVFTDFAGHTPQQLIKRMVDCQDEEFDRLDLPWTGLYGRPLHAIDCQGLFCEIDKYARAAFPELKSNRVRIKQEFREPQPPIDLFYPPKWNINERLRESSDSANKDGQVGFHDLKPRLVPVPNGELVKSASTKNSSAATLFDPLAAAG